MTKNQSSKGQAPWEWKVSLFRNKFAAREDRFYKKRFVRVPEDDPETGQKIWVEKGTFMLACDNYGSQEHCLITRKEGGCAECSKRVHSTLTNEAVSRHIFGEDQLCLITLREEGIRFGAIDFDKSSGEGLNAVFEDARTVRNYCMGIGVPCYIARSSNKGYHLYFFFKDFVPAHVFTSFARHLLKVHEYYTRHAYNPQIPVPEVFPKQSLYREASSGNGIRVPMSEPDMKRGKNCWVDDEGAALPFEHQWEYFENTEDIEITKFDEVIKKLNVEILMAPASKDTSQARKMEGRATHGSPQEDLKQSGSFWNIVAGCPAMMEYWAKSSDGTYSWDKSNPKGLFNAARVASMNLAMPTTDGEAIIRNRWQSQMTERNIELAKREGYKPTTCRWMQENSVCHVGKHPKSDCGKFCMKKLPPTATIEGKLVVNPDKLPEEQWGEPSPYRYANNKHMTVDDIIERLHVLFADRKAGDDEVKLDDKGQPVVRANFLPDNLEEMREMLFKKIGFLDAVEIQKVRSKVTANKWMSAKNFDEYLKIVKKASAEESMEKSRETEKSFMAKSDEIFLEKNNSISKKWIDAKGNPQKVTLTNFWIELLEDRVHIRLKDLNEEGTNTQTVLDREFMVTVHGEKEKHTFDIKLIEWMSDSKFFTAICRGAGSKYRAYRGDYDIIRNSIGVFSENVRLRKVIYDIGYYRIKTEDSETKVDKWVMPSVIVTKDGVLPNNEYRINMDVDLCRPLDFRILEEAEVKDIGRHIANEFFYCNNPTMTMALFGHAMAATMTDKLAQVKGYSKAPVLWIAGDHGQGKSFVAECAQHFFGNFGKYNLKINSDGSPKSWTGVANKYRHSFMLIDDVKESVKKDKTQVVSFVQGAYDRSARTSLQRSGDPRQHADKVRGLVCITGEDYPEQDASAISRMILLDTELNMKRDLGARVVEKRSKYCGFTPHVIHFWMGLADDEIKDIYDQYYNIFYVGSDTNDEKANASRICENLAFNMLGFRVGIDTMHAKGSISDVQRDELLSQHQKNLELLKVQVMARVADNRASEVFLKYLKQVLSDPQKYSIHGWKGTEDLGEATKYSEVLGFMGKNDDKVVYLYFEKALSAVTRLSGSLNTVMQAKRQILRQLYNDGYLDGPQVNRKDARYDVQRKTHTGVKDRVVPLLSSALGMDDLSDKTAQRNLAPTARVVQHKKASSDDEFPI